jgi:hypothetical protein
LLASSLQYGDQHAIQIFLDLRVGEPDHLISTPTEPMISISIAFTIMRIAIDLDNQCDATADEIADKSINRYLTAEL